MFTSIGSLSFDEKLEIIKNFFVSFLPRIAPQFQDCFYQLAKTVTIKTYESDQKVVVEGDEADSMIFWSSGSWKVTVNFEGHQHVVDEGHGCTIFGEQVIVNEHLKRKATITANGTATAFFLYSRDLRHLSTTYPVLYSTLLALIILVHTVRLQRLTNRYMQICELLGKHEEEHIF